MPPAAVIGQASGTGTSLVIPVTDNVPGAGVLHVVTGFVKIGSSSAAAAVDDATDTNSHSYVVSTGSDPLIGLVRGDSDWSDPVDFVFAGSIARFCGTDDLTAGDDVTLTFISVGTGTFHTSALLAYIPAYFNDVEQLDWGAGATYDRGYAWRQWGQNDSLLSWNGDLVCYINDTPSATGYDPPGCTDPAIMISAVASYPADSPSLLGLTEIGEEGDTCSITCGVASIAASERIDPGATFSGGGITAINYQVLEPTGDVVSVPPDPATVEGKHAYYHNGEWHIMEDLA